ncbi:MAG: LptF/LptG family permease [Bacteroidaceae bacterium]|nr:LptF/LptG family permease [Bacteroidaceae bacterium]
MFRFKRLYGFMIQSFLPVFLMTFFICLFIVLMQFLWKYVDEMVGKGLELSVLFELFFYAAVTMVPLALPLSILLASLMTFGNLGERLELLAIKAAGVSLLHVMRPLIFVVGVISVLAFFFQNNVLPQAQVKMWTLLYSMRQKSPELDIPEGVFYDQINGYNLYVREKNHKTGIMRDMMIYDMSQGFDNAMIVMADSGLLKTTPDKKYLILTLYDGESFENLKTDRTNSYTNIPYRRETFSLKELLIPFDANFNRMDEGVMSGQYIGKDYNELRVTIDSLNCIVDSMSVEFTNKLNKSGYFSIYSENIPTDSAARAKTIERDLEAAQKIDLDSLWMGENNQRRQLYLSRAIERANSYRVDYLFNSITQDDTRHTIRRHQIELMKKFTLSLACLIFFFIGAPLGAIIRKGGLGVPIVVSVILFIIYYIIDNTGYKLARDGVWEVWQGIWLSSAVLLPLGIFLTTRATKDSAVLNLDLYADFFRHLFGKDKVRKVTLKEIVMVAMEPDVAYRRAEDLTRQCRSFIANNPRLKYAGYWLKGYDLNVIQDLATSVNSLVEYTSETTHRMVATKLMDYPVIVAERILSPSHIKPLDILAMVFVPLGVPMYLIANKRYKNLIKNIESVCQCNADLMVLLQRIEDDNRTNK